MSKEELSEMNTDEYRAHVNSELSIVKRMVATARNIISGLLIVAIAGWVVVAVSDHFDLKQVKSQTDWMYPIVSQWYYGHPVKTPI